MKCDRTDPRGWVPFCGDTFDPVTRSTLCPHPRRSDPEPTADESFQHAVARGWMPPNLAGMSRTRRQVCAADVVAAVGQVVGQTAEDLLGRRNHKGITQDRALAMAVCYTLTNDSYPELGRLFDGRDHKTVMHSVAMARTRDTRVEGCIDTVSRVLSPAVT